MFEFEVRKNGYALIKANQKIGFFESYAALMQAYLAALAVPQMPKRAANGRFLKKGEMPC